MIDNEALARTFSLLARPAPVHWMAKSPSRHAAVGGPAASAEALIKNANRQDGWDFFVCLNPSTCDKTKPAKSDITAISCIGLDVDPIAASGQPLDHALVGRHLSTIISEFFGQSNNHVLVNSGRGLWAWLFVETTPLDSDAQRDEADAAVKGFTDAVGEFSPALRQLGHIDSASAEISRVARCPGTVNHKNGQPASIILDFYPIEPVRWSRVCEIAQPFRTARESAGTPTLVSGSSLLDIAPHMNMTSRQFAMCGIDHSVKSRHAVLFATAKNLWELGVTEDLAEYILWSGASRCIPNLNKSDPGIVHKVVVQVWKNPRTFSNPGPSKEA